MRIYLQLIKESFSFAADSLLANKLRTFLSLLGVTIGIFAIIAVFTMVDSIRKNINNSVASLGDQVIYVQKWPWIFDKDFPWWKYMNRPQPNLDEMVDLKKKSELGEYFAFQITANSTIKYKQNSAEFVNIAAVSDDYEHVKNFEVEQGRYFSELEFRNGKNVIVLGDEIAKQLFENQLPIDQYVVIRGRKLRVIGTLKREGQNLIDLGLDNSVIVPINFAKTVIDIRAEYLNPSIMIKSKMGYSNAELIDELTGLMRGIRRLTPKEEDNFALNESKLISNTFDQLIGIVNIAGVFIGFFSILVGGFGIANIMFVSVKERTNIIGIQKSLGAKNYFVLTQFLFESVMLCILGGLIGLFFVFLLSALISVLLDFDLYLSVKNIILGLGISTVIGIISGIVPAISASRLDPVEAMRAK
jgi:putative ABC transport system permease protein